MVIDFANHVVLPIHLGLRSLGRLLLLASDLYPSRMD
jgi:hypothetical protein